MMILFVQWVFAVLDEGVSEEEFNDDNMFVQWVFAVLDEPVPEGEFEEILKNGVVLCKMMNKISPNSIPKFKEKVSFYFLFSDYLLKIMYCEYVHIIVKPKNQI